MNKRVYTGVDKDKLPDSVKGWIADLGDRLEKMEIVREDDGRFVLILWYS